MGSVGRKDYVGIMALATQTQAHRFTWTKSVALQSGSSPEQVAKGGSRELGDQDSEHRVLTLRPLLPTSFSLPPLPFLAAVN